MAAAPAAAQQITGVPGSPERDHDDQGRTVAAAAGEIRRQDRAQCRAVDALLAAARRAAEGRAERAADHDRRLRLRRPQHLRRRDPDAQPRPDRRQRPALHQLQFDGAVLADARGADHRAQSPLGRASAWSRSRRPAIPGYDFDHHPRQGDDRPDPQGQRLSHVVVRQGPQHAGLPGEPGRAVRPVADRHGLRILLRLHRR